jgi:hypothetical protein
MRLYGFPDTAASPTIAMMPYEGRPQQTHWRLSAPRSSEARDRTTRSHSSAVISPRRVLRARPAATELLPHGSNNFAASTPNAGMVVDAGRR